MVKVVLEDREALQRIEDRLSSAIQDVVESNSALGPGQKKLLRNKMAQISSCFIQKVKRNTRVLKDDWSDVDEEDEPDRKAQKKEHLEPEDMVLKARVEALKRKVRDVSERVKEHRKTAPAKMKESLRTALEQSSDALKDSVAASDVPKQPQAAFATMSEAQVKAFVEDAESIAARVAKLHRDLPLEIGRGRSTVKLCQEWARKPLSRAEQVLAEGVTSKDKDRKGLVLKALSTKHWDR